MRKEFQTGEESIIGNFWGKPSTRRPTVRQHNYESTRLSIQFVTPHNIT